MGIINIEGEFRLDATAASRGTEAPHPRPPGLDALPEAEVLAIVLDRQAQSLAADAAALRGQERLVHAGAGSSAPMA